MSRVPSPLWPFKILIFFSLLYHFPKKGAFKEPLKYTSWRTRAETNHSKAMKNNNFPLLCTGIKIAVSYSNRHFVHATSQTPHITKGNNDYFCKLRALLWCAALKRICPTTLIPQTAVTALLLEPLQSMSPHWATPAREDGHGRFEGRHQAAAEHHVGQQYGSAQLGTQSHKAILSHKASSAKASPSTQQWRKTVPGI